MSETTYNKNTREDEIDLLDLFRRMGKSITRMSNAVGRAVLISIMFLLKKWLALAISVLLGIGASYLLKISFKPYFTSDLVLRANSVSTTSDMIAYLNRLHTYCRERNISALADAIYLTKDQVKDIKDIGAFWIIDDGRDGIPDKVDYKNNHNIYDTLNIRMQDRLDIRVITEDYNDLQPIKSGIIRFINSDSLFQQRNRVRLRQNQELLSRLNFDILQLDSIQKVVIKESERRIPQTGSQMIFLQQQNTQLLYPDVYKLHKQKQSLEVERDLYLDIVTVLSEFTITFKRVNSVSYYAIKIVPLFFIFTLLLLIYSTNKEKLKVLYDIYK